MRTEHLLAAERSQTSAPISTGLPYSCFRRSAAQGDASASRPARRAPYAAIRWTSHRHRLTGYDSFRCSASSSQTSNSAAVSAGHIAAGDRICLVGRNGSGKSTLLRIAAGLMQPDTGYRFAQPGATIQYLPQEPDLSGFATTLAYVEAGFSADAANDRHRALYLLKELGLSGLSRFLASSTTTTLFGKPSPIRRPVVISMASPIRLSVVFVLGCQRLRRAYSWDDIIVDRLHAASRSAPGAPSDKRLSSVKCSMAIY